jgi:hypothetical protein
MTKKKYSGTFFTPDPGEPISNIFAIGGNMFFGHGLKWVSRKVEDFMGLSKPSVEQQIALNRSKLGLRKLEIEIAASQLEKEKRNRLLDQRLEKNEMEISQRKLLLADAEAQKAKLTISVPMQVISGALATGASPEGLVGPPDQVEACQLWLNEYCEGGNTIAVVGKKGSGKTAFTGRMAEYAAAVYKKPVVWVGLPREARMLLPAWISMADSVEMCPPGSVIICDEAGINYLSLAFNTDRNVLLRKQLMIARHRNCVMIFACQSSRDMDASILRMCDCFIWKEPGLHQPLSERTDMRPMAKKAAEVFSQIPKEERCQVGYVFSDSFEGAVRCSLPSFWSEQLSHVYSNVNMIQIQEQGVKHQQLQQVVAKETKLLDEASLEQRIMERRRRGDGIKKIADAVGCTTWKVRQVLDQVEKGQL